MWHHSDSSKLYGQKIRVDSGCPARPRTQTGKTRLAQFNAFKLNSDHFHKSKLIWTVSVTYVVRDVCLPSIDKTTGVASVTSHCTMNRALSKKCTVNIVWCIAWNSPDHVCRINVFEIHHHLNLIKMILQSEGKKTTNTMRKISVKGRI